MNAAAERVAAECVAQGVPLHVEDPVALDRVARLLLTPASGREPPPTCKRPRQRNGGAAQDAYQSTKTEVST